MRSLILLLCAIVGVSCKTRLLELPFEPQSIPRVDSGVSDLATTDHFTCTRCAGICTDLSNDPDNCGACGKKCDSSQVCVANNCFDVAGSLDGLAWLLPCTVDVDSQSCADINPPPQTTALKGAPGLAYDVTLRFTGVIEQKSYQGGSNDGAYWQIGGTPASDGFNWYELQVSSPSQVFYLNRGQSFINHCFAIDYQKTVRINAGASISLVVSDIGGHEIKNIDANGQPLTASAAPANLTQPYNGQFIEMQVVSVTPAP